MRVKWVLGGVLLAVLLVVGEATSGAVLADGVVRWAYFVVAVVAVGFGVPAHRWLFKEPGPTLRLRDGRRGAPVFHDVAMVDLGVHRSSLTQAAGEIYVDRDIDGEVRAAVATAHGVVLVHGPALAGATRTLVEAVRKERPGVRLVAFEPGHKATLACRVEQARRWKRADDYGGVALWLDRLGGPELFKITTELLNSAEHHGVQLLVTAASDDVEAAERLLPDDPRLAVIGAGAVTGPERNRLLGVPAFREVVKAHADTPVLLGRLLVSLEHLERHMTPNVPEDQDRIALVRAVVDWHRLGVPLPLTKRDLVGLFPLYLGAVLGLSHQPKTDPDRLDQVLHDGLRLRNDLDQPLIHKQGRKRNTTFRPHPLLAALADSDSPAAWPLHREIWTYLCDTTSGPQRHQLGLYAYGQGLLLEASELLIVDTNSALDPAVMHHLGHAEKASNPDHARTWWQRAINSGHPDQSPRAMFCLGVLKYEQNVVDQARDWWQRVVESGHPDHAPRAMGNLGVLEKEQDDMNLARSWYQQAVKSGHPDHAPEAMANLGVLEDEQGAVDQARDWWQRVVESGHPDHAPRAMASLGNLEYGQDDVEARNWYQRAVDSGHPDQAPRAMYSLGFLENRHANMNLTRNWYQRAVDFGHRDYAPRAMVNLGVLENEQGRVDEARNWWQRAVDSGHPDQAPRGMFGLGNLEHEQGRIYEARDLYQQVIASDHSDCAPRAMANLGNLEHEQGRIYEARDLYQQAIASNHSDSAPAAMINLGLLENEQGRVDQARNWWQSAINSGHPQYGPQAKKLLRELTEFEHDQRQAKWRASTGSDIDENCVPP